MHSVNHGLRVSEGRKRLVVIASFAQPCCLKAVRVFSHECRCVRASWDLCWRLQAQEGCVMRV
jgi:hypothetical protein